MRNKVCIIKGLYIYPLLSLYDIVLLTVLTRVVLTVDSSVIYDAYNETLTTMFYTFQICGINAFEMKLG